MKIVTRKARATKSLVTLGSANDLGLDDGEGATKWYTICEVHHIAIGHATYFVARDFSTDPREFCEFCVEPDLWCSICENDASACEFSDIHKEA